MIYELEKCHYERVFPILHKYNIKDYPVLTAILGGNNRAKVYVDHIETPKTALIWAINCMYYFIGDYENPEFNDSFENAMNEKIAPESLKIGANSFICTLLHEEGWKEKVETFFKDKNYEVGYRQGFSFDTEKYNKRKKENIPNNCSIRKIDMELILKDKDGNVSEDICEFWNSVEEFLEKGVGYCVLENERVATSCFSCYASDEGLEININTYNQEDRNKGYATLAASAFIDYCISNNKAFSWEAYDNNTASIVLAEKLGFERSKEYLCYEFIFND